MAHSIKTIEIKEEKCGTTITWTDGYNAPRYINLRKWEEDCYNYEGEILCGDKSNTKNWGKLACDKLRIFPLLKNPCIEVESITFGGKLRAGSYEFVIAGCDQFGNEMFLHIH